MAIATALAVGLAVSATALPAAAAPTPDTDFFSSFETDDPPLTWTNVVETDAGGRPKMSGVTGRPQSGGIPGNISDKIIEVTANGDNPPNETVQRVVDGDENTKWLVFESTGWVQVRLDTPVAVVHYALTSANDVPDRDPKDWTLQASTDGQTWVTLDTRTGQDFTDRYQTKEYRFSNDTEFLHYRLNVTANHGTDIVQLAELQLSDGDTTPKPPAPMYSLVDNGPGGSPTAKANAGWSGRHALRYSGGQTVDGRGYAYNKVFDVDIAVTAHSELSYLVFPELTQSDLDYPSTYAAVDLAFDDGTYLSDLGAVDQYGFGLSPQAQGASKSLYADQWNLKRSSIGKVAAGKRIDRILVAYDSTTGTGSFKGWVDDIRVTGNPKRATYDRLSDYALTTRGTNSTADFSRGNTFPATAVPHGFNFWTPMTNAGSTSWLYQYQRDNNADNRPAIQAFTASHEPSPWMGDRQTFQVMPSAATGQPNASRSVRALSFDHANEVAKPHYYGVTFDNGLKTEIAPTDHAAMFRFTFTGERGNLIFDNINNQGGLTVNGDGTVTGFSDARLGGGATRMFVYGSVDRPVVAHGKLTGGGGSNVTGYLAFDTSTSKSVTLRIATSLISVDQARKNLGLEIADGDTFDAVRARAQRLWDDKLKVIEVEGASEEQLVTLYSNLYRLFLYPNSAHENVGTASAPVWKHAVQSSTSGTIPPGTTPTETGADVVDGKVYVNNGFWDTYRTTWPAYTLFSSDTAGELVDGFVQQYKDGGWVSRWSAPGYSNLMTGTSSDVSFADAYVKGVRNFDVRAAYDAAVRNATVVPPGNPNNSSVGRKGLQDSIFRGYTPSTVSEGVSWALEGYINDFGIANMAAELADDPATPEAERSRYREEEKYFRSRALNYVHMFDPNIEFFQGRDRSGQWKSTPEAYEPHVWGHHHDYTETNGWNFAFHVPHDGQGLANLYGGREALAEKLDEFFATPETGTFPGSYGGVIHEMREARDVRMGMWGFSNQVSHHIPWMYTYAGQPAKTQQIVREVLSRMYLGSEIGQGYAGDEDNGETSAWYLFGALGLYPLQVGSENYVIGSPLFTKATVRLDNGKKIVVNARNNSASNVYVQSLKVNGKRHDRTWISHDELTGGAVLDFTMGSRPSSWGTGEKALPTSITPAGEAARPLSDTRVSGGPAALSDDTSTTRAAVDAPVQWTVEDAPEKVTHYTLTSGPDSGTDPQRWSLQGSYDGDTWTTIDSRDGERFTWRLQTRSFMVDRPGRYLHYRLELDGGDSSPVLAEVELLATPTPACTKTVSGEVKGQLEVKSGVTCLAEATVKGPVKVRTGAALYAVDSTISGPVSVNGADAVVLRGVRIDGPLVVSHVTGEVGVEGTAIGGPVSLSHNEAPVIAAGSVAGPLSCSQNTVAPSDNGLPNVVKGPTSGQCRNL
ncbi:GH92 family glycosyl hydrolase [Micromonospora sp. WMMA1363]|uniref:GH92 family glycosyl hydrolase n=1 Tax=Micromonospora sp. WMMA1363 TaxID=3053985 RepID=UPI00259C7FAE|nr:GH92 family glycosyl hydrolase [Micromonospora sp. WMMA1363]MDM4718703.1 GH92 family glycosyl hydrolase [Micromonospora sp. WMMA1363]